MTAPDEIKSLKEVLVEYHEVCKKTRILLTKQERTFLGIKLVLDDIKASTVKLDQHTKGLKELLGEVIDSMARLLQAQAAILEKEGILSGRCTHCDKGECPVHVLSPYVPASQRAQLMAIVEDKL